MTRDDLQEFRDWFSRYSSRFFTDEEEDRGNIGLKVEHTFSVCRLVVEIAKDEDLGEDLILLAETAALLHDVGRFPQYRRYRTFRDASSVNHGKLGAETLREEMVLRCLPDAEEGAISDAVRFHNACAAPVLESPLAMLLLKLVRDADKLDIWDIFLDAYEGRRNASQLDLGVPDIPRYSPEIMSRVAERKTVSLSAMRTLNDLKLLQLSWVYDLNFAASYRLLIGKNYITRFETLLPKTAEIQRLLSQLRDFVLTKSSKGDSNER